MISFVLLLILFILVYIYNFKAHKYWLNRGIAHPKPLPVFGNCLRFYRGEQSLTQLTEELYWKYPKEKLVGFFRGLQPELVIRDPKIIKRILMTDFYSFSSRGVIRPGEKIEPLAKNVFMCDGDLWHLLRKRISPAFSSGKMHAMFPLVGTCAQRLQTILTNYNASGSFTLDAFDIITKYGIDVTSSIAFGFDLDSLNGKNSTLSKYLMNIPTPTFRFHAIRVLKEIFPSLFRHMRFFLGIEKLMTDLVTKTLVQRDYKPSGCSDLIDQMLECQNKGPMVDESIEKRKRDGTPEIVVTAWDFELTVAQCAMFSAAGTETTIATVSMTLHQLAWHPEIQQKVQEEIDRVLDLNDSKLCFDAVQQMTYLDWVCKETLRMIPSAGMLIRKCIRKCTFPDLNVTIDPGVRVIIPLQALQNDSQYFKDPHVFRPERFNPDIYDKKATKFIYMPFGKGRRKCIGQRLGMMQTKAGLAAVLSKFSVEPSESSIKFPKLNPQKQITQILGGLPLVFRQRKISNT